MKRKPQAEIMELVMGTFLASANVPAKVKRQPPHRCLGCGKVTKHIFCPATKEACHRAYMDRRARKPW
jgi:hypothetical protein